MGSVTQLTEEERSDDLTRGGCIVKRSVVGRRGVENGGGGISIVAGC